MEKIVWISTSEIVDKNFNYMIKNYYSSFTFKYNWDNNKLIKDYMKRLFIDSFINDERIRKELPILMHNIEDYFVMGINNKIFTKSNIRNIYNRLKDDVKTIGYTDKDNILSSYENNKVLINRDLRVYLRSEKNSSLTPGEVRRIYLYKEMNKVILSIKNDKNINKYLDSFESVMNSKENSINNELDKSLVEDGFKMIEDLLAQNLAEEMAYKALDKERPRFIVRMFNNTPVVSNLDKEIIYQRPVTLLGKTLAGISSKSDILTLINMSKVAFETSLVDTLASIYKEGPSSKYYDLFILLQNFGVLYREYNKTSNLDKIYIVDLKRIYKIIDTITERNLNSNIINLQNLKPINFEEYLNA